MFQGTSKTTCWSFKHTVVWSKIYHSEAGYTTSHLWWTDFTDMVYDFGFDLQLSVKGNYPKYQSTQRVFGCILEH